MYPQNYYVFLCLCFSSFFMIKIYQVLTVVMGTEQIFNCIFTIRNFITTMHERCFYLWNYIFPFFFHVVFTDWISGKRIKRFGTRSYNVLISREVKAEAASVGSNNRLETSVTHRGPVSLSLSLLLLLIPPPLPLARSLARSLSFSLSPSRCIFFSDPLWWVF